MEKKKFSELEEGVDYIDLGKIKKLENINREPQECSTLGCKEVEVKDEDGNLAHYCKTCLYCSECGKRMEEHTWSEMSCEKCDFVTCDYCGNEGLYIHEHPDSEMARVSLDGSGYSSDDYLIPNGMKNVCRLRCYDEVVDYYDGKGKCRICGEHHPITQDENCNSTK